MRSTVTDGECRQGTPHTRFFSWICTHEYVHAQCMPQDCVSVRTMVISSMFARERSSSFSGCHSSSLSLPSLSLTSSSTPTSQPTLLDHGITAQYPRKEASGSMAVSTPLTNTLSCRNVHPAAASCDTQIIQRWQLAVAGVLHGATPLEKPALENQRSVVTKSGCCCPRPT